MRSAADQPAVLVSAPPPAPLIRHGLRLITLSSAAVAIIASSSRYALATVTSPNFGFACGPPLAGDCSSVPEFGTVLSMDRQALITALFGVAVGAMGCYSLFRRAWWRATGSLAIGAAALLNLITEGPHSSGEDLAKFAATSMLMLIFIAAAIVYWRRARSVPDRRANHRH